MKKVKKEKKNKGLTIKFFFKKRKKVIQRKNDLPSTIHAKFLIFFMLNKHLLTFTFTKAIVIAITKSIIWQQSRTSVR